jgi:ribonucleotide monophosphatase NagD (HAD superfamily)
MDIAQLRNRLTEAEGVLVDLESGLLAGQDIARAIADLASAAGERLVLFSDNSAHTPREISALLAVAGLIVPPHRIILAGALAIDLLAEERPGARVLLLANHSLRAYARRRGLHVVDARPDVVLVAQDTDLDYARLQGAARALSLGVALVATSAERSRCDANGVPAPEAGAIVAALCAAVPSARPRIIGKPKPHLFRAALDVLDVDPAQALVISDDPDIADAGAAAVGIPCLIIDSLSGTTNRAYAEGLLPHRHTPRPVAFLRTDGQHHFATSP